MAAKTTIGFLATALLVGACSLPVMGQANGGGGNPPAAGGQGGNGGGGGGGGQRGNWDPAQMRQRMLDRIKDQLGSSDDEFAALQPKIEKVLQDMRDAGGFGMGMRAGRNRGGQGGQGGQAAPDANQPQSPVQLAAKDLHDTLDNKDAKPEDIKAKLDTLRAAKSKAKDDLAAAQKDLQGVLTQRQEAVLVEMGLLD